MNNSFNDFEELDTNSYHDEFDIQLNKVEDESELFQIGYHYGLKYERGWNPL